MYFGSFEPPLEGGFLLVKRLSHGHLKVHKYRCGKGVRIIKKLLCLIAVAVALVGIIVSPVVAANPSADVDCNTEITDPYGILGTGTRAELYGCKSIGNSGEEQGIYTLEGDAGIFGYPADYGTCKILVKWSGDYGETPYLDFGTVFNNTRCSNGYVEIWGDNFGTNDPYSSTPYVYSIGGTGSLIHP